MYILYCATLDINGRLLDFQNVNTIVSKEKYYTEEFGLVFRNYIQSYCDDIWKYLTTNICYNMRGRNIFYFLNPTNGSELEWEKFYTKMSIFGTDQSANYFISWDLLANAPRESLSVNNYVEKHMRFEFMPSNSALPYLKTTQGYSQNSKELKTLFIINTEVNFEILKHRKILNFPE